MIEENLMWRETGRRVSLFGIDAIALIPFLLFLLSMSVYTLTLSFVGTLFFIYLERKGFTVYVFIRWIRSKLIGPKRYCRSNSKRRFYL